MANISSSNIDISPTPRIRVSNDGTISPSNRRSLYLANNQSPAELKRKLQEQLSDRTNQIQATAEYGQALVQQKELIEQRIRELDEAQGDVISPELQNKLAQLEKEAMSLDADTRNVFLNAASASSATNNNSASGLASLSSSPIPTSVLDQALTPDTAPASRSKDRRNRNNNRTNDIEFAAEIGQNLLKEVKRLQALVSTKEEKIKELEYEKAELERVIEMLNKQLRAKEESEDTLKTQVWELELKVQSLDQEKETQTFEVSRLRKEIQLQEKKLSQSTDLLEQVKAREVKLSTELADSKTKYERQVRSHKKAYNDLKKENQVISQALDDTKQDVVNLKAKLKRKDEMATPTTTKNLPAAINFIHPSENSANSSSDEREEYPNGETLASIVDKFVPALNQIIPQAADAVKQMSDEYKVLQVKNGSLQSENEELKNLLNDREEEIIRLRDESAFPNNAVAKPKQKPRKKTSSSFLQEALADINEDAVLKNGQDEDEYYENISDEDGDTHINKTNRPNSDMFKSHPLLSRRSRKSSSRFSQNKHVSYNDNDVDEETGEEGDFEEIDEMITEPIVNVSLEEARSNQVPEHQDPEGVKAARAEALENLTKSNKQSRSSRRVSRNSKNIESPIFEEPETIQGSEENDNVTRSSKNRGSVVQERISQYEHIAKKPKPNSITKEGNDDDEEEEEYDDGSSADEFASAKSATSQRQSTISRIGARDSTLSEKRNSAASPKDDNNDNNDIDDQNIDSETKKSSTIASDDEKDNVVDNDTAAYRKGKRETFVTSRNVEVQTEKLMYTEAEIQTDSITALKSLEELKKGAYRSSTLSADIDESNNNINRFTLDLTANANHSKTEAQNGTERLEDLLHTDESQTIQKEPVRTSDPPPRPSNGPPQNLLEKQRVAIVNARDEIQHADHSITPTITNSKGKEKEDGVRPAPNVHHQHTSSSGSISTGSTISSTASSNDQPAKRNSNTSQADDGQTSFGRPRLDPSTVEAITLTMMGEFLYKYTRRNFGGGTSEKRHQRFFWVHPYTRTLYWSTKDPGGADMIDAKSSKNSMLSMQVAYIESVKQVVDHNPSPPGLHHMSLVVKTPGREIKFTAPTKERHEIWFKALNYLIERAVDTEPADPSSPNRKGSDPWENQPDSRHVQLHGSSSPNNNTLRTGNFPQQDLKKKSSFSKLSALIRRDASSSSNQPSHSPLSHEHHTHEDISLDETGDLDKEDFENVRECCDGRHNVTDLAGKRHRRN
ncbi:5890_t:CDS:2 [Ambispora leptoticha]|uniref:5890_t:CDS:1 n=1 Tax=Ambispora leptoticha TaxID=144679 RepID=A0A9N9FAM0_9GLOM|nr:5890_t:CDS:2 [Ambispora leptoticha]